MLKLRYANEYVEHEREIYNIIDHIGDLGGVIEIFAIFFGFFIGPFTNYSFTMTALRNIFVAKSSSKTLFKQNKSPKKNHTNHSSTLRGNK